MVPVWVAEEFDDLSMPKNFRIVFVREIDGPVAPADEETLTEFDDVVGSTPLVV